METNYVAQHSGRLSGFLKNELGLSTTLTNRLKFSNSILVNGVPVWANYEVQTGDTITLLLDEPEPEYPAEDLDLDILYEDEFLLAVDKPAGMLIHPSRCRNTGTLANGVIGYYRRTHQACAFHPATRLDRDTFGVVLLGKNSHVHRLLGDLQQAGHLQKTYLATVFGRMPEASGTIDAPIARLPLPSLLRKVDPDGKPSRTEYRVLRQNDRFSLLSLRPCTGRTHQLRVHCAHLGCPILGDPQYGTEASQKISLELGLSYQQLCAKSLCLSHPITGKPLEIRSHLDPFTPEGL